MISLQDFSIYTGFNELFEKLINKSYKSLHADAFRDISNNSIFEGMDKLERAALILRNNAEGIIFLQEMYPIILFDFKKEIKHYFKLSDEYFKELIKISENAIKKNKFGKNLQLKLANTYFNAALTKFESLQDLNNGQKFSYKQGDCSEIDSPFYNVKKYIQKCEEIYDDITADEYYSNNFRNAFFHLFELGGILLNEIYMAIKINDEFLFENEYIAERYFMAGKSFMRSYKIIADKHIIINYGTPLSYLFPSLDKIQNLFPKFEFIPSQGQLAECCFKKARDMFYKEKRKRLYMDAREKLKEINEETENFEYRVIEAYNTVHQWFNLVKVPFLQFLNDKNKVKESYLRDIFWTHISLLIEEYLIGEHIKPKGRSDLIIVRKRGYKIEQAIAEFKIWGRGGNKKYGYKKVIDQLRTYISEYESFGIIIMINKCKNSRRKQYKEKVIESDALYVPNSIEDPSSMGKHVSYIKSSHYIDNSKDRKISVYHFLIDLEKIM